MPARADHEQRRRQIAEALWRLAARGGLESVSLRLVAEEAGVSLRLVQYYFRTRQRLLLDALTLLNAQAEERARERMGAVPAEAGMRGIVRGVLLELLPLDDERRTRHVVYAAYFVRMLTDPDLAASVRDAPPSLEQLVEHLLGEGTRLGEVVDGIDPATEAVMLVALATGLQATVLLSQLSAERAVGVIDGQLDRLFR